MQKFPFKNVLSLTIEYMTYLKLLQTSRCLGWFKTGRNKLSCDTQVQVLPKRQNKMADIVLDRQKYYPWGR